MGVPNRIFCVLQMGTTGWCPLEYFRLSLLLQMEQPLLVGTTGSAMEGNNSITPVTDGEQWSEGTGSSSEGGTAPQDAGYAPLENYQMLQDDDEDDEEETQEKEEQGSPAQETAEAWREDASEGGSGGGGGGGRQSDVASLMLRAMEAEYQACVESEERSVSNGPIGISDAAATAENESEPQQEQVDGETLGSVQRQTTEQPAGGGETEGDEAAAETPRRPISPLGRDRADRVMRAMQGFALPAPPLPSAGFDADWGSAGAVANLAANTTIESTGQGDDTAERSSPGANED